MLARLMTILALGLLATSCAPPSSNIPLVMRYAPPLLTVAEARPLLADRSRSHGTQIEYASADGRAYLWYPGNPTILAGHWKLEERSEPVETPAGLRPKAVARVCYRYGGNTYNPATGHQGGGWECTSGGSLAREDRETRAGDVFGLSRRRPVPFVLAKPDRLSFEEISERLKTR